MLLSSHMNFSVSLPSKRTKAWVSIAKTTKRYFCSKPEQEKKKESVREFLLLTAIEKEGFEGSGFKELSLSIGSAVGDFP